MNTVESLKASLVEIINALDQEGQTLYFVDLGRGLHTLVLATSANDVRNQLPRPISTMAYNSYNVTDQLLGQLGAFTPAFLGQNYEDPDPTPVPDVGGLEAAGGSGTVTGFDAGRMDQSSPSPRLYEPGGEG